MTKPGKGKDKCPWIGLRRLRQVRDLGEVFRGKSYAGKTKKGGHFCPPSCCGYALILLLAKAAFAINNNYAVRLFLEPLQARFCSRGRLDGFGFAVAGEFNRIAFRHAFIILRSGRIGNLD